MRSWTDAGTRLLIAMATGAALVALVTLANVYLIPGGLLDAAGGWRFLAKGAALLCGVCALAVEVGIRLPARLGQRGTITLIALSAIAWGMCLSQTTLTKEWVREGLALPWLASAGAAALVWLTLYAALAGLLAGQRATNGSATRAALTPLWLTPLWGGITGIVFGLTWTLLYLSSPPVCRPGMHCYGLDISPWLGLNTGLSMGVGGGFTLGLTLAIALRLALALRPVYTGPIERTLSGSPTTTAEA